MNWINTEKLSFNNLLLLERVQLGWIPDHVPEADLAIALTANPVIDWYLRNKCSQLVPWLDKLIRVPAELLTYEQIYQAEQAILKTINDWLVYVIDPAIYDKLEFLEWDDDELHKLIDFTNLTVLDIGAGTGRLTFTAAPKARFVYAVEPVDNLRLFIRKKAKGIGVRNVFAVDGLITEIPFPNNFAEVTMSGFVFGDMPEQECDELERVTKPGGTVILCPGNADQDTSAHETLVNRGYDWSRFEATGDGWKRKYWKQVS